MAIQSTATAVFKVTEDPYLTETVCHALRLSKLEDKLDPGPPCTVRNFGKPTKGIGLHKIIKPLRFYVRTQEHKWLLPALVVGGVSGLLLLGYTLGRKSCRR